MGTALISAPSNIALIKYMGKTSAVGNRPTNSSLSYTLDGLRTFVRITPQMDEETAKTVGQDHWRPLEGREYYPFAMSPRGQKKFLDHLLRLKEAWGLKKNTSAEDNLNETHFLVESANNFPADSGIASSASSFAALTLAASQLFQKINPQTWGADPLALSKLSQLGSGSSCRSFFSPWALWKEDGAQPIELPFQTLLHSVIVPESRPKEVSSSEAHLRVAFSSKFPGRTSRAESRLVELIASFKEGQWQRAYEICWDEFTDMHELFAACPEPFDYRTTDTLQILSELQKLWKSRGDGPLVTMDAGSSVHLLWRPDQRDLFAATHEEYKERYQVWSSH